MSRSTVEYFHCFYGARAQKQGAETSFLDCQFGRTGPDSLFHIANCFTLFFFTGPGAPIFSPSTADEIGYLSEFPFSICEAESFRPFGFLNVVDPLSFLRARFLAEYLSDVSRNQLLKDIREYLFPELLYLSQF